MCKGIGITSIAVVLSIFATSAFGGPQVLEVSPSTLDFSAIEGGGNPAAQVLSIWNSGHGPMDWTVTEDCNWIVVEPNSGTSSGEVDDVNVIVDISGLTGGTYNCQLTVTGSGAPNSPQVVDVNLVVVGPVSLWRFDEGSGEIAYDSVGDNDGNLINGPVWTTGIIGEAIEFDGVDDYVSLSQNAITETEFTLAVWANHYGQGGGSGNINTVFSQRDGDTGNNKSAVVLKTEDGDVSPTARAIIRSSNGSVQLLSAPKKDYGEWHHYAMTVSLTDFVFYIDGVEVDRTTNNQAGDYITSIDYVDIGRSRYETTTSGLFNGAVDDARIYDRALSAEEVAQLWEEGLGGRAFNPEPYDGASDVDPNVVLSWSVGIWVVDVNGYDVYFGTDYNDVNDATTISAEYMGRQDANSWDSINYDANGLGYATTYYWRIDEVNGPNTWKGDVWRFTTWALFDPNLNLVSWWEFNEGSGTTAYDTAGDNDGNLINGPNWTRGIIGEAIEFDGVDDYVVLSHNAVTTTEFTVAAWANHYGPGGGEVNTNRLFSQRDAAVGNNYCAVSLSSENSIGAARAVIRSSSGSVQYLDAPKKDYNEWHHYAMTVDS
ncbi:MAG: LamG-like jellyroll fold domain-containing protein, partial [Planctomycetota bacterium]